MRKAEIKRSTKETDITLTLNIDGSGKYNVTTDSGFFNHMMELFTRHGRFDLKLSCVGDSQVDYHHTVEDVGICLGQAFKEASGDKKGIVRYGHTILPMDEVLILCAVDFSGRACLNFDAQIPSYTVGDFDTELVKEFMTAFCREAEINLHIKMLAGENSHHIIEGMFKALGRVISEALTIDVRYKDEVPSTKGVL